MPPLRFALVSIALVAGCTGVLDEGLTLPADDDAGQRDPMGARIPAEPSQGASSSSTPACASLIGDATGRAKRDLSELCATTRHDSGSVGMGGTRTAPREAFECLLDDGHLDAVLALADAREPGPRAFAREAMERADVWTPQRVEAALLDDAHVPGCIGCTCALESLSDIGLREALASPDRTAMLPILRRWSPKAEADELAEALRQRGDEAWIDNDALRALVDDAANPRSLRVAAAFALAGRGEATSTRVLYEFVGDDDTQTQEYAWRTLDRLGVARAWDELEPPPERGSGNARRAWLVLGAHHHPERASVLIDADSFSGPIAAAELPTKLFAPRAEAAVCGTPRWSGEPSRELTAALAKLPERARCRALAGRTCSSDPDDRSRRAFVLAPQLAAECGMTPPTDDRRLGQWDCHRNRPENDPALQAKQRARLIEIERRAKAAADG